MQTLYRTWDTLCEWQSTIPLHMTPPASDTQHITGPLLPSLGRTTALELRDAQQNHRVHHVHNESDDLQIVAVVSHASKELCLESAKLGVQLIHPTGAALHDALLAHGLLDSMRSTTQATLLSCTRLKRAQDICEAVLYVFVKPSHHELWPTIDDPLCTCTQFVRFATCEHT